MVRKIIAGTRNEEALERYGFCAFLLSKKDRECSYPPVKIGEVVFLKGSALRRRVSIPIRLIAVQELQDGGCISIYTVALEPEKYEPEET